MEKEKTKKTRRKTKNMRKKSKTKSKTKKKARVKRNIIKSENPRRIKNDNFTISNYLVNGKIIIVFFRIKKSKYIIYVYREPTKIFI